MKLIRRIFEAVLVGELIYKYCGVRAVVRRTFGVKT